MSVFFVCCISCVIVVNFRGKVTYTVLRTITVLYFTYTNSVPYTSYGCICKDITVRNSIRKTRYMNIVYRIHIHSTCRSIVNTITSLVVYNHIELYVRYCKGFILSFLFGVAFILILMVSRKGGQFITPYPTL